MALQRPTFPTSRFVEAYDTAEVDAAVDRVFAALSEPTPSWGAADVQALRFTPTRLRDGYTMDAVDDWLDQAGAALAAHAGPGPAAPAPSTYVPTQSEAIVEVASSSTRWLVVLAVLVVVAVLAYVSFA